MLTLHGQCSVIVNFSVYHTPLKTLDGTLTKMSNPTFTQEVKLESAQLVVDKCTTQLENPLNDQRLRQDHFVIKVR